MTKQKIVVAGVVALSLVATLMGPTVSAKARKTRVPKPISGPISGPIDPCYCPPGQNCIHVICDPIK
jgi:hypothetical protein